MEVARASLDLWEALEINVRSSMIKRTILFKYYYLSSPTFRALLIP
jgi:hypothetical protein